MGRRASSLRKRTNKKNERPLEDWTTRHQVVGEGWEDVPQNIQMLCADCNTRKSNPR